MYTTYYQRKDAKTLKLKEANNNPLRPCDFAFQMCSSTNVHNFLSTQRH